MQYSDVADVSMAHVTLPYLDKLRRVLDQLYGDGNGIQTLAQMYATYVIGCLQADKRSALFENFSLGCEHTWIFGAHEIDVLAPLKWPEMFEALKSLLLDGELETVTKLTGAIMTVVESCRMTTAAKSDFLLGFVCHVIDLTTSQIFQSQYERSSAVESAPTKRWREMLNVLRVISHTSHEMGFSKMPRFARTLAAHWEHAGSEKDITIPFVQWLYNDISENQIACIKLCSQATENQKFCQFLIKEKVLRECDLDSARQTPATFYDTPMSRVFNDLCTEESRRSAIMQFAANDNTKKAYCAFVRMLTARYNTVFKSRIDARMFIRTVAWALPSTPHKPALDRFEYPELVSKSVNWLAKYADPVPQPQL